MNQSIDKICGMHVPDKTEDKNTTSHLFKHDLIDFFSRPETRIRSCLEIGTNHGWTTKILAQLFNTVTTIDFFENNIENAKKNNKDVSNITYIVGDAYNDFTYETIKDQKFNAVFIDCVHEYDYVIEDINRALTFKHDDEPIYLIFDDYGHPESLGVNKAINEAIRNGLTIETYLGQDTGYQYNSASTLINHEGIILRYG